MSSLGGLEGSMKQEAGNLTASQSGGTRPRGRIQASLLCWEVIGGLNLDTCCTDGKMQ